MESNIINIQPLGFPWETRDPFIFCVHHRDLFPKGNDEMGPSESLSGRNIGQDFVVKDGWRMYHGQKIPGFPYHPHRGFETVSVVEEGFIDHTDSLGASARFGNGDVQWMTAGKGVLHSEMFPLINQDKDNPLELFQIWLNLPKASKFVEPHFKMLWNEEIPVLNNIDSNGKKIQIRIIAGQLDDLIALPPTPNSWASNTENEVSILTIKMESKSKWTLPKTINSINRTIYFYKGTGLKIDEYKIPNYHSIHVKSNKDIEIIAGDDACYLLILQGKPIEEPVVQHGPFVMNTREEIQEAFQDYQRTHFGGWPWPNQELVHSREKGRFAIHADGREEIK